MQRAGRTLAASESNLVQRGVEGKINTQRDWAQTQLGKEKGRWKEDRRSFQPSAGNSSFTLPISFPSSVPHPKLKGSFFSQSAPITGGHPIPGQAPQTHFSGLSLHPLSGSTGSLEFLGLRLEKLHTKSFVFRYFEYSVYIWKKENYSPVLRLVGNTGFGGWGWPPAEMCSFDFVNTEIFFISSNLKSFTGVLHMQREKI